MDIKSLKLVYFSPTKTTKRVLEGIAEGMQTGTVEHLDLSPPEAKTRVFEEMHDELAIIGAPVYGGRIPLDAVERLQRLKGNGTPAVVVVLYGNREYEDALRELRDLAAGAGFIPLAGGAFIGEHSFASESKPIASGRPDAQDLKTAKEFGELIGKKMEEVQTLDEVPPLQVPGDFPFKERRPRGAISPITKEDLCTTCGTCATVCPTGVITVSDVVTTDAEGCILCCACIKDCPTGARVFDNPRIEQMSEWLYTNCRERKEPETYLAAQEGG